MVYRAGSSKGKCTEVFFVCDCRYAAPERVSFEHHEPLLCAKSNIILSIKLLVTKLDLISFGSVEIFNLFHLVEEPKRVKCFC